MAATVSTDWAFRRIDTVILENELLRVVIMPELGGKVWELTYKPKNAQLLWHHPRLWPRPMRYSERYDDSFVGGWDEIFPNAIAEELSGEALPDHGEVWSLPWTWVVEEAGDRQATIHLSVQTVVRALRLDKWVTLQSGKKHLHCRYAATNLSGDAQPFLWLAHVPFRLNGHCRIDVGARRMHLDAVGRPRGDSGDVEYAWPYLVDRRGLQHDMREVLPTTSRVTELQWATELESGRCSLASAETGLTVSLNFDPAIVTSCHVFTSFGGWRDLNVVILEPATGYPPSLAQGARQGTIRTLQPGETVTWDLVVRMDEV